MSITALLELRLKPESLEASHQLIHEVLADTRAFAGNEGVEVVIDAQDPAHVLVIEHWESMDADTAYRQWRATPAGASPLGTIVNARPVLTHWNDTEL
jgi:quinol monooxygenase YgiN